MSQTLVGKYEVITTLGRGSMGVVYKAKDPEIDRIVAIKTLRSVYLGEDAAGNDAMQRFKQESRSAGKLRHPNIVTIFEAGRAESGSPFIVMEYIEGKSLEAIIAERAPLEPKEGLHYLVQIATAIDYAHKEGVIHRDIKPSNVIVDKDGHPHLLDFGVAKLSDSSLTPAGTVVGTPSYMAPEQIKGESLDGATDRFAFAVMSFEVLSGKRPFLGQDFTTVVTNIIHHPPLSLKDAIALQIPLGVDEIFLKALSKDRKDRYSSCYEFIHLLAQAYSISLDSTGVIGYYGAIGTTFSMPTNVSDSTPLAPTSSVTTATDPLIANSPTVSQPSIAKLDQPAPEALQFPQRKQDTEQIKFQSFLVFCSFLFLIFAIIFYLIRTADKPLTAAAPQIAPAPPTAQPEATQIPLPVEVIEAKPLTLELAIVQIASFEEQLRIQAMQFFLSDEKYKTKEVLRAVVGHLNDGSQQVRGYVIRYIGKLQNEAALKLLEKQLAVESDNSVKDIINDVIKNLKSSLSKNIK
jgi:serine/threonine protein kinase